MKQHGFSLLELSIVLTILAIVLAGGITLSTAKVEQNQIQDTYDEISEIDNALDAYAVANTALPCPAPINAARADAEFGRAAATCDGSTAGLTRVEYPASSGNFVIIGGVPFYTLEMPDEYLADAWNGRYLYAVGEPFITAVNSGDTGFILVQDDASAAISDQVAWVVVSHGASREGAFSAKAGTLISACDGGNLDGENCDGDGVFKDAVFNDGDVAANFYDDYIRWETVNRLLNP